MMHGRRAAILWVAGVFIATGVGQAAAEPAEQRAAPSHSVVRSETADAATQALLLDGVRAFRAERYDDALHIFHQVESQHLLADIGFYQGMALHKLGRHAEALSAFRAAHRQGLSEPIADYYQAVSCYRLGMMARALREFSALQPQERARVAAPPLGPKLMLGVQQFLRAIEQAGFSAADAQGAAPRAQPAAAALFSTRVPMAFAGAEAALGRSPQEALEWLDEAAELLVLTRAGAPDRGRFRDLLLRVLTAVGAAGRSRLDAQTPGGATDTALEANRLWCRVAGTPDCAL